jgi:hypothetical protein
MAASSTSVIPAAGRLFFGPIKAALGGTAMLKLSLSVAALVALGSAAYAADAGGDFIATWATSPQPLWGPDFLAPVKVPRNLWNQTLREVATISQGGKQVRLVLSNLYGTTPLPISAAHVALAGDNGAIQPGSDHAVTFDGQPGIVIPPGAEWISDPVAFPVDPLSKLSVSLYFQGVVPVTTTHWEGRDTAYISDGNTVGDATIKPSSTMTAKPILAGILVDAPADAKALVTFGDSITDGDGSKVDQTHRWPDFLAKRLVEAKMPMTVVNEGIAILKPLYDAESTSGHLQFSDGEETTVVWTRMSGADGALMGEAILSDGDVLALTVERAAQGTANRSFVLFAAAPSSLVRGTCASAAFH